MFLGILRGFCNSYFFGEDVEKRGKLWHVTVALYAVALWITAVPLWRMALIVALRR